MVSVIIPVFNVEKYIARCLDSVINQTYKNLEIIVVNDATPDNSMYVVEEYAARDNRIRIVHNPRNMGLMMTRKNGYTVATGDYLTFVDSDDYLPLNAIEVMLGKAEETHADIVAGNFYIHDLAGNSDVRKNSLSFGDTTPDYLRSLLKNEFAHNLWAKLYKRELFVAHAYIHYEGMVNAEDKALFYQIIMNVKKMVCIEGIVYHYMVNKQSSTNVKLTLSQIECVIKANKIVNDACDNYRSLHKLADSTITTATMSLYCKGYPAREIKEILFKYKMNKYGEWLHALKVMRVIDFLRLLYYKFGF